MSTTLSTVLHAFIHEIRDEFPADQLSKVDAHSSAISRCTARHDHRRSHRCATWAIDLVKSQQTPHSEWEKIKEEHKFWEDAWAGVSWTLLMSISPEEAIRTEWAQEAVDVAKRVAGISGWDSVPWEELLVELIDMENS